MNIFPNWVPITSGFGYSLTSNEISYSGKWIAPYTEDTLLKTLKLIDPKTRYDAHKDGSIFNPNTTYEYQNQIQHSLIKDLTSQRASIKPIDGYSPQYMTGDGRSEDGVFTSDATAQNIIKNAIYAEIDVEWFMPPTNSLGLNCCYVKESGSAEFQELGSDRSVLIHQDSGPSGDDYPGKSGAAVKSVVEQRNKLTVLPLSKGIPLIDAKTQLTIEYPWVSADLVNKPALEALRGTINFRDFLTWPAGTMLYEGSDIVSAISPLGYAGYTVTHKFTIAKRDWNLVPIIPDQIPAGSANLPSPPANTTYKPTPEAWISAGFGWATFKPKMALVSSNVTANCPEIKIALPDLPEGNRYSNYNNRLYRYADWFTGIPGKSSFTTVMFYYNTIPNPPTPIQPINPPTAT